MKLGIRLFDLITGLYSDPVDVAILEALMDINGQIDGMIDFLAWKDTGNYHLTLAEAIEYLEEASDEN